MVQGLGTKRAERIVHMLDATYKTNDFNAPKQERLQ